MNFVGTNAQYGSLMDGFYTSGTVRVFSDQRSDVFLVKVSIPQLSMIGLMRGLMGFVCSAAMAMDVKFAVRRVCATNEEYAHYAESHLDTLIDVYADCMGVVSSLWLELCELVHSKFAQGM